MSMRYSVLHSEHPLIDWTQPDGARDVVNRQVRLAAPGSYIAAEVPRLRQVRIEHERPIDEGHPGVEVAYDMGKRESAIVECDRIIVAQVHRPSSKSRSFRNVLGTAG